MGYLLLLKQQYMPDLNIRDITLESVADLRLDTFRPYWLFPVHVKILFITDGGISYRKNVDFGLSDAAFIIRDPVYSYVRFEVTLAHRRSDSKNDAANDAAFPGRPGTPDYAYNPGHHNPYVKDFRFRDNNSQGAQMNINNYDQVWFFGLENDSSGVRLDDTELGIVTAWMNAGGSVFATGDHQDLGAALAGRIPRVKSMRKWQIIPGDNTGAPDQIQTRAQQISSGQPDSYFESFAPGVDGWYRHDTSQPHTPGQINKTEVMPFTNQADSIPQPIEVERYYLGRNGIFDKYAPHPILCGGVGMGIIDVLPDHAHEGEIVVPPDSVLNSSEYPDIDGNHPLPKVIAYANVLGQPSYRYSKADVKRTRYGVIGAYDGESINHGRIVVDATWHHWMDINIAAVEPGSITPYPSNLKNGNPDAYAKIMKYYRNIAVWLSSRSDRNAMLHRGISAIIDIDPEEFNIFEPIYRLGLKAKDVLGRSITDCTVSELIYSFIEPMLIEKIFHIPHPECLSCPDRDFLDAHVLGGIIRQLLILKDETQKDQGKFREVSEKDIAVMVTEGIEEGYEQFVASYKRSIEEGREMLGLMEKALNRKTLQPENFIAKKELSPKALKERKKG
jgi:hypothetical protein